MTPCQNQEKQMIKWPIFVVQIYKISLQSFSLCDQPSQKFGYFMRLYKRMIA